MKKILSCIILLAIIVIVFLIPRNLRVSFISRISPKNISNEKVSIGIDLNYSSKSMDFSVEEYSKLNLDSKSLHENFENMTLEFYKNPLEKHGYFLADDFSEEEQLKSKIMLIYNRRSIHDIQFWREYIVTDVVLVELYSSLTFDADADDNNANYKLSSKVKLLSNFKVIYDAQKNKIVFGDSKSDSELKLNNIKLEYSDVNKYSKAYLFEDSFFAKGSGDYRKQEISERYPHGYNPQVEMYGDRISESSHEFTNLKLSKENDFASGQVNFYLSKKEKIHPEFQVTFSFQYD